MEPKRRRIAVVIPKYGLTGGAEGFAAELTERIARDGRYEVHVFANRWTALSERVTFHRVPIIAFPKFLTTISFAWFARRLLARMDFDLVHAQDRIFAADLFTMHGIPHRLWMREIRKKHLRLPDRATAWVEKTLVGNERCRYFLAVSELAKEKFLEVYKKAPPLVEVVSPGVDAERYQHLDRGRCRREIRKYYGIGSTDILLLFVSMNFEVKGLDRLIEALAVLKTGSPGGQFKLLVVGKGNVRKFSRLAGKLNVQDQVIFAGTMEKAQLDQAYLASDIFSIFSSFDTFGMVVLEAMAASLPVVISANVGAKDLVREGSNGFIIEAGADAALIAKKFLELSDAPLRAQMGAAALQTARRHSWEKAAGRTLEIYDEILQGRVNRKGSRWQR